jgi:trehalose/maltose hydrolase-like predicted phosphorylase
VIDSLGGRRDELHAGAAAEAAHDPSWQLREDSYIPALEHEIESRFAVANGYLGVRASLDVTTTASHPRTFLAGLFDASTRHGGIPALVPIPNWLRLELRIDDEVLSIDEGEILSFGRLLDLKGGTLRSKWTQRMPGGVTVTLRALRFASLSARHIGMQWLHIEVDRDASLTLEARLEPVMDELVLESVTGNRSLWRTATSGKAVLLSDAVRASLGDEALEFLRREDGSQRVQVEMQPGRPLEFVRTLAAVHGESPARVAEAMDQEFVLWRDLPPQRLLAAHEQAWARRWDASDVAISGDQQAQRVIRFGVYHLTSAANPECSAVSVGARGLTGEGYLGHVFWDTDIFLLPFYMLTWPEAARAMLLYRHRTLPAAREKAARLGFRGALYAWESATSGEEVTPTHARGPDGEVIPILCGLEEHHISADVAYAVWQYWHITRDSAFMLEAGAEILLETARFWASRAVRGPDGRFHIRGVIGPDEYHETVDDNAYTNNLARWNLQRGAEVARWMSRRWPEQWDALASAIALHADERGQWEQIADGLVSGFDPQTRLYEQFDGYFRLDDVDLDAYANRATPIDLVLGRARTQETQVLKQADVLMLLALLPREYSREIWEANFDYYEPRSAHGSSLSPPIHGLLAARLGRTDLAQQYFEQTAAIDLDNTMGNAAAGVHMAALGGLWQLTVFGFGGLDVSGERLSVSPRLPDGWEGMSYPLQWRGRQLRVEVSARGEAVSVSLLKGRPLTISVFGMSYRLETGSEISVDRLTGEA